MVQGKIGHVKWDVGINFLFAAWSAGVQLFIHREKGSCNEVSLLAAERLFYNLCNWMCLLYWRQSRKAALRHSVMLFLPRCGRWGRNINIPKQIILSLNKLNFPLRIHWHLKIFLTSPSCSMNSGWHVVSGATIKEVTEWLQGIPKWTVKVRARRSHCKKRQFCASISHWLFGATWI